MHATAGSIVVAAKGIFVTTVGHLDAAKGETVYRSRRRIRLSGSRPEWGRVIAVTTPQNEDPTSSCADGLDVAAIAFADAPASSEAPSLDRADPRALLFKDYVRWRGGSTGTHEGWLVTEAAAVEAMERNGRHLEYRHALMVNGNPPGFGGRGGDSGSAVYDARGRLLGHLVGTDGARSRGLAPSMWFQMFDLTQLYLEEQCGPIERVLDPNQIDVG